MNILSIQSWVASGHVGNAAAMFPLQRLGAELTAIHTVQFSNHPGHGGFTGRVFPAAEAASLVEGLAAHGALAVCDGVLSGYIGAADVGDVVLDAVGRVRSANGRALWCCDPVMGDDGKLYVSPDIPAFFANRAVPGADILIPNQFELATLSAAVGSSFAAIRAQAVSLQTRMRPGGPKLVLVSSLRTPETPPDALDMLLACEAGAFRLRTALFPVAFRGAGDVLSALFLFLMLKTGDPLFAMTNAARSLAGILWHTWQSGESELQLVAAQSELVTPTRQVHVEAC